MIRRHKVKRYAIAFVAFATLSAAGHIAMQSADPLGWTDGGRSQAELAMNEPAELAAAASRGIELSSDLGLEGRYLIFSWQRDGRPSRGECVTSRALSGRVDGPNCYTAAQIRICNAYQSAQRTDRKVETVGLVSQRAVAVGVRVAGRETVVPVRSGVFTVITQHRIDSCKA
jgi:hypothetical protein